MFSSGEKVGFDTVVSSCFLSVICVLSDSSCCFKIESFLLYWLMVVTDIVRIVKAVMIGIRMIKSIVTPSVVLRVGLS